MTSREYLEQLRKSEKNIEKLTEQSERLMAALGIRAINYDKDKVQTSPRDSMTDKMCELIDLDSEIRKYRYEYEIKRNRIVKEIIQIEDWRYSDILYKRYVEFKRFEQIAMEMSYDYDWIRTLHSRALTNFAEVYGFDVTTHTNTD